MPSYRQDPTGGYVIRRDDGTEFRSAIPVGMPTGPAQVNPTDVGSMQMDPSIVQAATAPQPDNRMAMNTPDAIQGALGGPPSGASMFGASQDPRVAAAQASAQASQVNTGHVSGPMGGDADKIRGALGGGQASMFDQAPQMDPRLLAAKVEASKAPPAGGGPGGAIFAKPPQQAQQSGQLPAGYYTTKAGYVPRAKSEQVRELAPEQQEQIDQSYKDIANAQQYGAQVGMAKAAEQYGAQQAYVQQVRAMEAQEQIREQQRQQKIQDQMQHVQSTAQDVAAQKIDRNRIWADGGRDAGAVAMAIGAFVQARGGPNTVAPLINKAIDDDLHEQEANLANKREGLAAQNNILGQMRQQFGDERSAFLAAKAVKTDDLARQIELTAAKYQAPQVAQQAQLSIGELRKQYAALMTELHGRVSTINSAYDPGGLHGPAVPKVQEGDVKHLDTELRKEKIPDAYASLADADRILDTSRGDEVPGLGKAKNWAVEHVPFAETALSDEGMANRQAIERAAVAVAHATGRVNENEVALIKKHMLGDGSVRAVRNGLRWGRVQLQNVDRSVRASVPGAAQAEYIRRGGLAAPSYEGSTQVTPAGEGQ